MVRESSSTKFATRGSPTDTHKEASPPRSPPHEADTMALEEQQLLKGTRLTRKGDPSSLHPI